uniref:Uncharacterized protein n=1 Tax=Capra hircus TaxID=9925 RepID=A0A8C2NCA5_CAPHI
MLPWADAIAFHGADFQLSLSLCHGGSHTTGSRASPSPPLSADQYLGPLRTTVIIKKHNYTVEGVKREVFPNLNELISKFEKPNQGLMFHLVNPIKRTRSCLRWRRSKIELDENSGSDYVDVLP